MTGRKRDVWDLPERMITLRQPWATLWALGAKRIETRSWRTPYTGRLGIHASSTFTRAERELCGLEPFRRALAEAGVYSAAGAPTGAIVGELVLIHCLSTEGPSLKVNDLPVNERVFGDFSCGRFGWITTDARLYRRPIPCVGALGVWRFKPEYLR